MLKINPDGLNSCLLKAKGIYSKLMGILGKNAFGEKIQFTAVLKTEIGCLKTPGDIPMS